MKVKDAVIIVTGGANGIGRALCERFSREGAKAIAVADRDINNAEAVAKNIDGHAFAVDVSDEAQVSTMVRDMESRFGSIDLYCSNAGLGFTDAPDWTATSCSNENWQTAWNVNVMAHIYGARACLPAMRKKGSGYFLITSSAAGLLSQIGDASYSTTKHAAIGFAESLVITHGDDGIGVSVLCPQAVDTALIKGFEGGAQNVDGIISPEQVAGDVMKGLQEESFLILPHPQVRDYMARKSADYDRWISGMRRFRQKLMGGGAKPMSGD